MFLSDPPKNIGKSLGKKWVKMLLIRIVLPSFKNKSLEDPPNSQAGFIFLLVFGKINALGVKLQFLQTF